MRSSHEDAGRLRGSAKRPGTMIYCQDHVFVFAKGSDGPQEGVWIPGFLAVFSSSEGIPRLAWTSYDKVRPKDHRERMKPLQITDVPPKPTDIEQFTLKLALAQMHSLWKHTPDLGRGVPVVKVTTLLSDGGLELPPFLFYHGGVRELFHAIRTLVPLSRSRDDPDVYLVNDQSNLLYQSVSCADEFRSVTTDNDDDAAVTPGAPQLPVSPAPSPVKVTSDQPKRSGSSSSGGGGGGVMGSALSVLTTVGRLARVAASVFPANNNNSNNSSNSLASPTAPVVVVAKPANEKQPKDDVESSVERSVEFKTSLGEFQLMDDYSPARSADRDALYKMVARPERSRGVEEETWISSFDGEGRIAESRVKELKHLAFTGGIHPTVRREMWKFLLKYYPWDSTFVEREQLREARRVEYNVYKKQWLSITPMQAANFRKFRDRKHMIEKDVMRTDRTESFYAFLPGSASEDTNHFEPSQNPNLQKLHDILLTYSFFNFDLGYCQGMNDLLSPILSEMDDEVDAFWCYKGLMDNMAPNFRKDQSGMNTQLRRLQSLVRHLDSELFEYLKSVQCDNLYFTFRWMLLHFKRELDYDGVKMVWEAIWSADDSKHFHLFIVYAILQKVRDHILMEHLEFDTLVQLCNSMSGKLLYPEILASAAHWELMFQKMFPAEDVRERILL